MCLPLMIWASAYGEDCEMKIKITDEAKARIFSMESMAGLYGKSDMDFGRFMRGFRQGMLTTMGALGIKQADVLPACPPDEAAVIYASFVATYAAFLNTERQSRLAVGSKDHEVMYGEEAQAMMMEAEQHLKEYKKAKAKKGMEH